MLELPDYSVTAPFTYFVGLIAFYYLGRLSYFAVFISFITFSTLGLVFISSFLFYTLAMGFVYTLVTGFVYTFG
jgi:hypothetical protein